MAWVRFTADLDFVPAAEARVCIAYKAGMRCSVTSECADVAKDRGAGVVIKPPCREDAQRLQADPFWTGG